MRTEDGESFLVFAVKLNFFYANIKARNDLKMKKIKKASLYSVAYRIALDPSVSHY